MRGVSRTIRALLVGGAALVCLAASASSAGAQNYCGYDPGAGGTCIGSYQGLVKNAAVAQTASWATCAGAKNSSGTFYGHYYCASDYACHDYAGGNLTPLAHNHEAFGQTVYGFTNSSWPGACPRGGVLGVAALGVTSPSGARSFDIGERRCLSVPDGLVGFGASCAPRSLATERGLVGIMVAGEDTSGDEIPGTERLFAVAPRGAVAAVLRDRSGKERARLGVGAAPIDAALDGDEVSLDWTTATGELTTVSIP